MQYIEYCIPYSASHPSLISQNFSAECCYWYGVKWIKSIFTNKGIMEQDLGYLFMISSSVVVIFFNKTNFKQYLFNVFLFSFFILYSQISSVYYFQFLSGWLNYFISYTNSYSPISCCAWTCSIVQCTRVSILA